VLAKIFATENVWQLINSAVSEGRNLTHEKDLVRLFQLDTMGADGAYVLQVIETFSLLNFLREVKLATTLVF